MGSNTRSVKKADRLNTPKIVVVVTHLNNMDQFELKSSLVEVCATNGVEMRALLVSHCKVPQNSYNISLCPIKQHKTVNQVVRNIKNLKATSYHLSNEP